MAIRVFGVSPLVGPGGILVDEQGEGGGLPEDPLGTVHGGTGSDLSAAPAGAIPFSDGATPATFGTSADLTWGNTAKAFTLGAPPDFNLTPNVLNTGMLSGQQLAFNVAHFEGPEINGILRLGLAGADEVRLGVEDTTGAISYFFIGFMQDGGAGAIDFYTAGAERWEITYNGNLVPKNDGVSNTLDFGDVGSMIRTGYFGTSVVVGTASIADGVVSLNLPTSAGAAGTLWNDGGTVKVAP